MMEDSYILQILNLVSLQLHVIIIICMQFKKEGSLMELI